MKTARSLSLAVAVALTTGALALPAAAKHRDDDAPRDDRDRLHRYIARIDAAYDTSRGGWVGKDGRPSESAVALAFRLARDAGAAGDGAWTARALATVAWTAQLQDSMSGGFTDRRQRSTAEGGAFEMHADVNGRRLEDLVIAWRTTGDDRWRRDAARVVNYCDRVLLDGRGGFITAQVGDRTLQPAANGIAIHAWLAWASATGDPRPRDFALRSLDRVWGTGMDEALGVLIRRDDFGAVAAMPQLADQIETGRALLFAAQACGRAQDMVRARALAEVVLAKFADTERGGCFTQASPRKDGTIRRAARNPGENARAALFFAELGAATGEARWSDAARRTIAAFDHDIEKTDLDAADWALALETLLAPEAPAPPVWQNAVNATPHQPAVVKFMLPRRR
ncbi:MAG: hypothetical protein HYR74_11415 [Candidatus Eisenbacteria bacterium]|nr:hypothetical protein [Candidatus Eisenbacteria bacterium]